MGQSCFLYSFTGQFNTVLKQTIFAFALFQVFSVCYVVSVYYNRAVEEKWRTTSSVSGLVEGLLGI